MAAVVPPSALTIREASSPAECGEISALFTSIWGGHQHIPPELGRAIVESGGYVVAARRGDIVVGASVAVVGQSGGHLHLHSHITGVVPSEQRSRRRPRVEAASAGVGARARHDEDRVDVRSAGAPQRSVQPGATRRASDAVRDRLLRTGPRCDQRRRRDRPARGRVGDERRRGCRPTRPCRRRHDRVAVPTPADIVALRAADPAAARAARLEVREALGGRMATGWKIEGVSADGSYLLRLPS